MDKFQQRLGRPQPKPKPTVQPQTGYHASWAGRLGNHMFIYAYVRSLAEKEKKPFNLRSPLLRRHFNIQDKTVNIPKSRKPDGYPYYQQDVHLDLLLDNRDSVRQWFVPSLEGVSFLEKRGNPAVFHVRGTDFKNHKRCLPLEYYQGAQRAFPNFIVITDDPEHASKHFKDKEIVRSTTSVDFSTLYHARTLVCSNSTFCWWAAFLGSHDQIVCPNFSMRSCRIFKWGIRKLGWKHG